MPNLLDAEAWIEALVGWTANWTLLDLTELIVSVVFAVFVTVTLSVFVLPTGMVPMESLLEFTEKFPLVAAGRLSPGG